MKDFTPTIQKRKNKIYEKAKEDLYKAIYKDFLRIFKKTGLVSPATTFCVEKHHVSPKTVYTARVFMEEQEQKKQLNK